MKELKFITVSVFLSLLGSLHMYADVNPISIVDFSLDWDADEIKSALRNAGYESVYEVDSIWNEYGSCEINFYSNTEFVDQFQGTIKYTPRTKKVYRVNIIQCIPSELFNQAAVLFFQEIVKRYGVASSGVYAKSYYHSDSVEGSINVEEHPLDSVNLKFFISEKKPVGYRWKCNGVDFYFEVNKLSNYYPEVTCTIENEKFLTLLAKEDASIEAERKEKEKAEGIRSIIYWCIGIAVALCILYFIIKEMIAKHKEEQEKMRTQQEKKEAQQKEVDKKYNAFIDDIMTRCGNPIRVIPLEIYDDNLLLHHNDILVFANSKIVVIGQNEYSYSDILGCTLNNNNPQNLAGGQVTTTKVNTGSMLGRAVVGGLTLGVAGAVVGALTASKETSNEALDTPHTGIYDIKINVKSITNPTIVIHLYNRKDLAEEIYSLMHAIIAMK